MISGSDLRTQVAITEKVLVTISWAPPQIRFRMDLIIALLMFDSGMGTQWIKPRDVIKVVQVSGVSRMQHFHNPKLTR